MRIRNKLLLLIKKEIKTMKMRMMLPLLPLRARLVTISQKVTKPKKRMMGLIPKLQLPKFNLTNKPLKNQNSRKLNLKTECS